MQIELSGPADEGILRDALRRIIERNLAFCLIVSDGISERIFYFAIGGIRVIASGPRVSPSIGEELLERGSISQDQFNHVNEAVGNDARRFAEAALQAKVCRAEQIQEAVVQQVEHEILDLFFWDGAEISLVEGQPPKSFYEGRFQTAALTCNVAAMLQSILERVDVWRQTVQRLPGGREVYETTERATPDLNGRYGRMLQLLDGSRTAADAMEKAHLRRVPSFEYLMVALQQGKIRRTIGSAAQRVTREQLVRDVELLEQALKQRVDALIVRRRLARTLEQVGEPARAASQWRELGDMARRENDIDKALVCYSECVRVLPTDFATRELILEIYRAKEEYAQVVAHGRPLADLFLKHNLLNRAKQLLLQLVGIEPADVGLRRQLILVLIGLGERDLALKHLRELARILEGKGAPKNELRDVYVRILALDPRDKNARKRLDEITGVATQRRVLKLTGASTAAIVLGLGTFFWMEAQARRAVNSAMSEARDLVVEKDLAGAKKRLQRVMEEHSMSRSTRSVQSFLAQIERMQREQDERSRRRAELAGKPVDLAEAAERRERSENSAADMAKEAARLTSEGRVQDAHRVYTELLTLHHGTRAADNVKVPLALTVLPRGARVLVNGTVVGHGSTQIEYSPTVPAVLEVEADGFERERIQINGLQPPARVIALHRPLRWTASFDAAVDAAPLVRGNVVFVAGRDRFLTAVSATDGKPLWRTPLGFHSDAGTAPVAAGDGIVVATATGEAISVDAATGEILWRCGSGGAIERPVLAAAGTLVVTGNDGAVRGLAAATGDTRWQMPAKSVASGAPFVLGENQVAWIDPRGVVATVAADSGRTLPRAPSTSVLRGTPATGPDDRLWTFAEDESLRLVTASSGTALRRFPVPHAFLDAQPAVSDDVAYVSAQDGTIAAFRASGDVVFRKRIDETAPAGIAHSKGRVYVGGSAGRLRVLDAATGEELWRFDAGSRITARPLVEGGVIYVVTAGGSLFALDE